MQNICEAALNEPGVRAVTIFNTEGLPLSRVGQSAFGTYEEAIRSSGVSPLVRMDVDTWVQSIDSSTVELNDLFTVPNQSQPPVAQVIGHVVIEISRDQLNTR